MNDQTRIEAEPLLNVDDIALLLKVSKKHVYREIANGRLACFKLGRRVRVAPEDVARYLSARRRS